MITLPPSESFGDLLKLLRKRARLTQRELAAAVGYTEAHLSRLENNERLPDLTTLAALFIPALNLNDDPVMMERLLKLAAQARDKRRPSGVRIEQITITHTVEQELGALEDIPDLPTQYVERPALIRRVSDILIGERAVALCDLAGAGKTSLAASIARTFAPTPVFWQSLTSGLTASADAILRQLALFLWLQGHTQIRPMLDVPAQAVPLPLDQQLTLLRAAFAQQPALLCFDDVHLVLGDETALSLIKSLKSIPTVSLLLTSREDLPLSVPQISLGGLERNEALDLVDRLGLARQTNAVEGLLAKTNGSPMLLRLAVGQLLDSHADTDAFLNRLESQPQVAAYLLETVSRQLSSDAQWLAAFISVLRRPVDLYNPTLAELCTDAGHPLQPDSIIELQRRHLIQAAGGAALHPLVHDYVYANLSAKPQLRKKLHRLAAQWFERVEGELLEAAYHYARAGQLKQLANLIEDCEEVFIRRGQALAAADILREALRSESSPKAGRDTIDRLRELHTVCGDLLVQSVRHTEAEAEFRAALALPSNPQVRASLIYRLTDALVTRNQYSDALALVTSALQTLSPADTLLRARLNLNAAMAQYNLGKFAEAGQSAEAALSLARDFEQVPWQTLEEVRARAHYWLANTARVRREPELAMDHAQQALIDARQSGLSRLENTLLGFIGGLLFDRGEVNESFEYRSRALVMAQELGDSYWAAYMLIHLSANHHVRNEPEAALEKLAAARDVLTQLGDRHGLADQANKHAISLLMLGHVAEARAIAQGLLGDDDLSKTRMFGYYLNTLAAIQLCDEPSDLAGAQTTLRRALSLPTSDADPMLRFQVNSTLAMAHLAANEPAQAQAVLANSPVQPGLSLWVKLERQLVEGFVAVASGDRWKAIQIADRLLEQAGRHPYYEVHAKQLQTTAHDLKPVSFPRCMWMVEQT